MVWFAALRNPCKRQAALDNMHIEELQRHAFHLLQLTPAPFSKWRQQYKGCHVTLSTSPGSSLGLSTFAPYCLTEPSEGGEDRNTQFAACSVLTVYPSARSSGVGRCTTSFDIR